jgi:hypothetical protein
MSDMLATVAKNYSTPPAPQSPASVAKPNLYNTQLNPAEELQFQQWVKANKIPWVDSPASDYDMRGFWKAMQSGDPNAKRAANLHFPDTFKTPWHHSISNESMYASPNAPSWKGNQLVDKSGKVVWDEKWGNPQ